MAEDTATSEKTGANAPGAPAQTSTPPATQGQNRSAQAGELPEEKRPPGDLRRRTGKSRRTGPFVKYVGAAAQRTISAAAWKSLNIDLKDEGASHTWAVANDKLVESDKFSDAQLDYLLIDDLQQGTNTHAFLLVDYDKDDDSAHPQLVQVPYN